MEVGSSESLDCGSKVEQVEVVGITENSQSSDYAQAVSLSLLATNSLVDDEDWRFKVQGE